MPPADFELEVTGDPGDETVILLSGDVDVYAAPELRGAILDLLAAGHHRLVLDLARVTLLDSTALGVLIAFMKHLERLDDGALRLRAPSRNVQTVLSVTGLDEHFDIDTPDRPTSD